MARTKQEIRNFLNNQVGKRVNLKAGIYNGQCVSLIKALLEFLGAPSPYTARGNARDVGDTLVSQGIAVDGRGWLTLCVNRGMGRINGISYGHIWVDLMNEANYEQNGAEALRTTKNTRPISHAQQFVNLDKYIRTAAPRKSNETIAKEVIAGKWGNGPTRVNRLKKAKYNPAIIQSTVNSILSKNTTPSPSRKSNETIAREVIAGRWGDGPERQRRISEAGYNYSAVQAIVNRLM